MVVAVVGVLRGQDAWRLPKLGAIEYRRACEMAVGAIVKTAAAARKTQVPLAQPRANSLAKPLAKPRQSVPGRYFMRVLPAPWLCQGELDDSGRTVAGPVRDLRDVLRAVAFDLRAGGGRCRLPRVLPYGDLTVSGSWGTRKADGTQAIRAKIRGRPPKSIAGEDRSVAERLTTFCARSCTGTLTMTRRFDATRGLVVSFAGEIDLVLDEGHRRYRRVRCADAWDFVEVRYDQDTDFRLRVAAAIRAGAGFVRESVGESRSFLHGKVRDRRSYGSGRLALALLTLLHSHVPADDQVLLRGFAELLRRKLVDTYSLAAALMAIARLGEVPGRELSPRERKAARKWFGKLIKNVDPRTDPAEVLRFNYVRAPRYDTSVQQYGLLGLYAAQRCGIEVAGQTFAAAARQLLAVQCPSSGRRSYRLVTHAVDPDEPPFGSMTSAGVSGLLLARAGMARAEHRDRGLARGVDVAVRDGFAWLARDLSLRCNPGYAERGRYHWYYWLYCLERSCQLAGIARLDGRDWYYEGALQLLAQQQPNGAFRSDSSGGLLLDSTCFAVLFLAKATARAAVSRR